MKKLSDLKELTVINSSESKLIFGGVEQFVQTNQEPIIIDEHDCTKRKEDGFHDTNMNGFWDDGESGYTEHTYNCPPCST
jgi:hypothetical protein